MPQRANITSVEAIQAFRTNLLIYLSKARPALDEAGSEVMRVRLWLETERRPYWRKEFLKRSQRLEEAESALFTSRMSNIEQASAAQQAAVQKARRGVAEAEDKLQSIKRWQRDYENRTDPLLKQLEKLGNVLSQDVPNATAYLNEVIDTLQKYSGMAPPSSDPATAPASGLESHEAGLPELEKGKS
jgi:hypothetical protein